MENSSYFVKTFAYDDHSPLATGYVTYTGVFSSQNQLQVTTASISNSTPIPGDIVEVTGRVSYKGAPSIPVSNPDYYWVTMKYLEGAALTPVFDANATKTGNQFSGLFHRIEIPTARYHNPGLKVILDGYDGNDLGESNPDDTYDVACSVQNVPPNTPDILTVAGASPYTIGETLAITAGHSTPYPPYPDNNNDGVCYDIEVFNAGSWSRLVSCDADGNFSWDTSSATPELGVDFRTRACDDLPSCSGWFNPSDTIELQPSVYDPNPPAVAALGNDPVNSSKGTLHITLDPGVNFPQTTYLIHETITNRYVQADGHSGQRHGMAYPERLGRPYRYGCH